MYKLLQQHTHKKGTPTELPKGDNLTTYSLFHSISENLIMKSISIKYVLSGTEIYTINGESYHVKQGEYLLANSACEGSLLIDSEETVKGLCIDISPQIISEVMAHNLRPDTPFPDISLDTFFHSDQFLENMYCGRDTNVGKVLNEIGFKIDQNPFIKYELLNDFYFSMAEKLIEDHLPVLHQLYGIKTAKHKTRKDLFKRLCKGKSFLDVNYKDKILVQDAAYNAALSEYHFFRLFKSAFNITPQQYLIAKRLDEAMSLLSSKNKSVTEVALSCGFSDIYSFSKAFKKQYGIPPSRVF